MSGIDEAMLMALVDGELDEVNRRRVERAVAADPALAERLATHRRLRARLSGHYAPVAEEAVPKRFLALLEQESTMVPMRRRAPAWRGWATGGAIAASLVLGLGIGRFSSGTDAGPIGLHNGNLVAQGALADALDTQLASAQDDAAIRIGLSFRRKGGGWCRSFDGVVAGVACRQGKDWQVKQALPGAGHHAATYRRASSADARIMDTVESLIDGAPVDAVGEKMARSSGWQ
ncbi:hypothetical protein J3E64_002577 [Sphingobium sp. OAS761]|uniref:anti-sigma factor family protein n=1 Tax=Sphingobium sp. OAS761 TaxID=2817901 RepID=UPI00209CBAE2|nr:anti-sigma factor [Sphingobium sp. OAS761]MCP1470884.1 hypothetical protein [Sphingobium sp. OAS761]